MVVAKNKFNYVIVAVVLLSFFGGCSSNGPSSINLMPAPSIYSPVIEAALNTNNETLVPPSEIFYATNRARLDVNSTQYGGLRGGVLRFGGAKVMLGKGGYTFGEVREISLLKTRAEEYPLKVTDIQEFGLLSSSLNPFYAGEILKSGRTEQDDQFAKRINAKLADSTQKDVYIYVHGYKVDFDNPVLVAAELWHFLGYDGAFVAFSWPSTPSTMAYLADLETAELSSYQLRNLIMFLAQETNAERINILGYSVGARLVERALHQINLISKNGRKDFRIGHVMLLGSDVDAGIFAANLHDGLLDVADDVSVYISEKDQALALSGWIFDRVRLGQVGGEMDIAAKRFLESNPKLSMVDVKNAAFSDTGNGHGYFRKSPWVSSDILMTLKYDLTPSERGLVRDNYWPIWTFPENYMEKLHENIMKRLSPD